MNDFRLLIDGRLVEGAGTLDVINPATGRALTTAPRADRAQLDRGGGRSEGRLPVLVGDPAPATGGRLLVKLAEALEAEQDEFARLLTEEQGKPLPQALWEIAHSIAHAPLLRHARPAAQGAQGGRHAEGGPAAQAARRRRGDHAVELPGDPADDQGRAGPARRQHGRGQAGPDHAADDAQVRRTLCPDPAARRRQRHRRSERPRDRPHQPPRRGQGRVHRLHRDRQEGDGQRRRDR